MEHIRSKINSLASEDSPYLLQHKDNPVHWYPFGDAAFAAAICEDKPIFLSIGYATCHWCHVMAHESFEDDEVAALLNRNFISIKVDREERPDVDAIYMSVAQMMTGSGGWPLTLILTPEGNPVFAATYIPKTARYGSMGLVDLLELVTGKWRTQRSSMLKMSSEITDALQRHHANVSHGAPDSGLLDAAFALLERRYDPVFGGFSSGTKFPTPHNLIFLLRYFQRTHNARALQMAENTLKNMRAGGIFDHFGLGFHRYSTDAEWLVPHFEKMLYDQAMLMLAYTEAFEAVQRPLYREVAGEIGNYLQNRMRSPEGAFYSAEDADSEGVEGKYYVWTMDEIHHALVDFPSQEAVDGFATLYHLHKYGNFESPHTPQRTNIPHIAVEELESWMELNNEDPSFEVIRKKLLTVREQRIPPLLDDKILTDWNGLAIAAFAKAGRVFRRDDLIGLARAAASHIKERMTRTDQTLWHRYRHGNIAIDGQLDDYAFLIFGLIELHQATFEVHYLEWAVSLTETANRLFLADDGSYYMAAEHTANLIVRPREFYDGALPSGNSVMMDNLVRLASLLGRVDFEERANRLSQAFCAAAKRAPDAHTHFLLGLGQVFSPSLEIVIVGEPADPRTVSLLAAAQAGYVPNRVVLQKNASNETALGALAPYTVTQVVMNDAPTGYVCVGRHCEFPTNSPDKVKELVKRALL